MERDKDREDRMDKRNITHYREEETVSRWEVDEDLEDADYISKWINFEDQQYFKCNAYILIDA